MVTTGHCLCGAIRYQYEGEPLLVAHCHCESCRRQTSSPVATFVLVPKEKLRFTQGQAKEFHSSPDVRRSFCSECGSPIYYHTDRRPNVIDLYAGSLSDPASLVPQCHVHASEQLAWFEVLDDLPRYPGSTRSDAPMRHGPRTSGRSSD